MRRRRGDESSEIDCLVGKDTYACNETNAFFTAREMAEAGRSDLGGRGSVHDMKTRVLLAEDDAQVRAFMAEALAFLGFEVVAAEDGEQALAKSRGVAVDIVLTDHRMPGLDGLGLVQALRGNGFAGRIYVASGVLSPAERAEYRSLGVDGIASKPMALAELNGLLRGRIVMPASGAA